MEILNIENELSRDVVFVKGIVKVVSLLTGSISEELRDKSKKQFAKELKKELNRFVKKYSNIFLDLSKRYNYFWNIMMRLIRFCLRRNTKAELKIWRRASE